MIREYGLAACAAICFSCAGIAQATEVAVYRSLRPFAGVAQLVHPGASGYMLMLNEERTGLQYWSLREPSVLTYSWPSYFGIGRSANYLYYGATWEGGSWHVYRDGFEPGPNQQVSVSPGSTMGVLDDDHFVLLTAGAAPQLSVWSMAQSGPVGSSIAVSGGPVHLAADAASGLVFVDHDDAAQVEVFRFDGDGLSRLADLPVLPGEEHDVVLRPDGVFLYYGTQQFDLRDLSAPVRSFAEPILASTWQFAYSSHSYFDPFTGERLGDLPGEFSLYATAPYARDVWAYDAIAGRVVQMAVIPEPATWALYLAGLVAWVGARRGRAESRRSQGLHQP